VVKPYQIKDVAVLIFEFREKIGVSEVSACAELTGFKPNEARIFWEIFAVRYLANARRLPSVDIENTFYIDEALYIDCFGKTLKDTFDQYSFSPQEKLFLGSMAASHVLPLLSELIAPELKQKIQLNPALASWKS